MSQKTSKITNPHDKFFKESMGRREIAASFIREYLPAEIKKHIDFRTLKITKDSHIDNEFREHFSDIIYTVRISGKQSYLYFLFEHKSYSDIHTAFQLLRNMVRIWDGFLRQNRKAKKLPLIVPIVLYHGKEVWKPGDGIGHLFEPIPGSEKYIPDFTAELFDISHVDEAWIRGEVILQIFLMTLKYIMQPSLPDKLDEIFPLFRKLLSRKSAMEYLEILLRYFSVTMSDDKKEDLNKKLKKSLKKGDSIMPTIAESWIREGKEEDAVKMIEKNMSNADIRDITGLSIKRIEELRRKKSR